MAMMNHVVAGLDAGIAIAFVVTVPTAPSLNRILFPLVDSDTVFATAHTALGNVIGKEKPVVPEVVLVTFPHCGSVGSDNKRLYFPLLD